MEINEIMMGYLTKTHNKTEDEIKALIFDGDKLSEKALENLLTMDAARVSRLRSESNKFDDGFKKGEKETLTKAEKKFKETFGFDFDGSYDEMLSAFKEHAEKGGKKTTLTEDEIKKHPVYLALEKERVPKSEYEKVKSEFDQFKSGIDRKMKQKTVQDMALQHLDKLNPIMPDDGTIASNLKKSYLRDVLDFDDVVEDEATGKITAFIRAGKRVEDAHGNPLTPEKLYEQTAKGYFQFKKQGEKGGAGGPGTAGTDKYASMTFNSEEDVMKAYQSAKTPEEKKELLAIWEQMRKSK